MSAVTLSEDELGKVNEADLSVTSARDLARERKRRERARKKQATSIEFIRTDASLFLHPDRLSQKAGAPKQHLRRMALKELVDNALDAAETASIDAVDADNFIIEDNGPGIAPEKVPTLFSVTRPMMSTKLIRRPTRGAVGNGLRVAVGAAFASGGAITVESRGVQQALGFDPATGETTVIRREASDVETGTKITVQFGPALPQDSFALRWAEVAIRLAGPSASPMLTHPDWYSETMFAEVIAAARGTAGEFAALFGVAAQPDRPERDIDPDGPANQLTLPFLQSLAPKQPKIIMLPDDAFTGAYKGERALAEVGGAMVPCAVQAWAVQRNKRGNDDFILIVNRTPTVADLSLYSGGESYLSGCGLSYARLGVVPKGSYGAVISVTTPAISLINDGKTPDLSPFREAIASVLGTALRRSHRPARRGISIKDAAYSVMAEAYLKASAGGTLPANARQIMYAARPHILAMTGQAKLNDAYFTQTVLPAYIEEHPEIAGHWDVVYDARGHLVEPHTGHSLPLGTLHVREYLQRKPRSGSMVGTATGLHPTKGPGDRYGAVLFIEKEGFEPLLRAAKIAERFDIAVMSTKGMSVIAARTLVDRLSGDGIKILVAHDLDVAGIRIFGTLGSDSSRYTFTHKPDIHRLGLTLEQAVDMDLQSERQDVQGDHDRLIEGLAAYGASEEEQHFITSGQRVELNAMPSDQFISWLEAGLREHGVAKVIPPAEIIEERARRLLGIEHVKKDVSKLEEKAREFSKNATLPGDLAACMAEKFEADPSMPWEDALAAVVGGAL